MPMDRSYREPVKSAYIAWGDPLTDPGGSLGQLHFDVVYSEEHERTAEVTSHTVEQGAAIVDHVRPNPDHLTLNVFVSNSPLDSPDSQLFWQVLNLDPPGQVNKDGSPSFFAGGTSALLDSGLQALGLQSGFPTGVAVNTYLFDTEHDYVQDTYKALTRLRNTATLCSVVTPKEFYTNMVIERIAMRRDASTGTSGNFEIEFREIRIVSSSITDAPLPTIPRAIPTVNKGKLDPKPTEGPKQSIAVRESLRAGVSLPGPAAGFPAPPGP